MLISFSIKDYIPEGWIKAGSKPEKYEVGIDTAITKSGKKSAYILSKATKIKGFGTLMQSFSAQDYLGERVKLTGYLKTKTVSGWAGLWFRVDSRDKGKVIGFDNMQDRALSGTNDWTKCEIVLDVPKESSSINYGALLDGTGQIWFDDLYFEVVDKSIQSTTKSLGKPMNGNFEE